ncbi:MAG: S8 family serine peptidase [Blastocatellales bacterium]
MTAKYPSCAPLAATVLFLMVVAGLMMLGLQSAEPMVQAAQGDWQGKIADWVKVNTDDGRDAEFVVILADKADLSGAARLRAKQEKGRFVRDALLTKAQRTQRPILDWLKERKVEHRSFYIVNAIWVKASRDVVDALAARADVARIEGNPRIKNNFNAQPTAEELQTAVSRFAPEAIELGVNYIRAPEVWAMGFTGQGIVIGGADTGIRWDHNSLKSKYRGWNGTTADHNYNWHDSIHSGGGVCGPNTTAPCDDDDHGTHTIGTVVGDDGGANQIGVAPGAKFIGCRNMDQGNGSPATYIECMEWFLAPYPIGGTPAQGDPSKAPDITTNSWTCPPSEGCSPSTLQSAVEAQRAAGIMMVVAAGNSGSSCSTVSDPPSFYAASYTVGAFSASTGTIASFSSRGPATADGSNRLKPEITAPGVSVRSALRGSVSSYGSLSGTSMATPHTAGAIALLWSARPQLKNQIQQTIDLVNQAAVDVNSTSCSSSGTPNNVYGWGRLDIKAAVDSSSSCSYSLSPTNATFASTGGNGMVTITTGTGCSWNAVSNVLWISINAPANGNGNGSVSYTVFPNSGVARSGTLTIAGQTFTVNQDAPCTFSLNPTNQYFIAGGGGGSVNVTASSSNCAWTAVSNDAWIMIDSGGSGIGNGSVNFTVLPNLDATIRSGSITIAGQSFAVTQAGAGLMYYPLSKPIRLFDTRAPIPGFTACQYLSQPLVANSELVKNARVTCDNETIPANAAAIVGNATVVNPASTGFITLWPDGQQRPPVSNLNFGANQTVPNAFTTALGAAGDFRIFSTSSTDFMVDITGYFAPPAANGLYYHPLPKPIRLFDTRAPIAGFPACEYLSQSLTANGELSKQARITCDGVTIPSDAMAIVGNATVVGPSGNGFVTLWPNGQMRPPVSNLNYLAGQTIPNAFTVGLGSDGQFRVYSFTNADFIVDINGYYSPAASDVNGQGLLYSPLPSPIRLFDTRAPIAGFPACEYLSQPLAGGGELVKNAFVNCGGVTIPPTAQAINGNATVIQPSGNGFITLWPDAQMRPPVSNLNYVTGQIVPNAFTVGLSVTGNFRTYSFVTTNFVVDVNGYYAP